MAGDTEGRARRRIERVLDAVIELAQLESAVDGLHEAVLAGAAESDLRERTQLLRERFGQSLGRLRTRAWKLGLCPLRSLLERLAERPPAGLTLRLAPVAPELEIDHAVAEALCEPLARLLGRLGALLRAAADASPDSADSSPPGVVLGARVQGDHVAIELMPSSLSEARGQQLARALQADPEQRAIRIQLRRSAAFVELPDAAAAGRSVVLAPVVAARFGALLVGAGGRTFALPLCSVREVINVDAAASRAGELMPDHWANVPRAALGSLLEMHDSARPARAQQIVVIASGSEHLGLVVERALRQQPIAFQALAAGLGALRLVAGAAALGDGEVALVLDAAGLIEAQRESQAPAPDCAPVPSE